MQNTEVSEIVSEKNPQCSGTILGRCQEVPNARFFAPRIPRYRMERCKIEVSGIILV